MDRIERCEEKYRELFGGNAVTTEGTDPEFMRILQRLIFGEICYTGSLDNRVRELITVVILAGNQALPQLSAHVGAALRVGCPPKEIREAIYQCAPFIGFPKTLNAISAMNQVFAGRGITLPLDSQENVADEDRYQEGKKIQEPLYGSEIRNRYACLPKPYAEAIPRFLTEFCFGDFMTRQGLDQKLRELLILVLLASIGDVTAQLRSHMEGAIKAGNSREELLCALLHAMPYIGFPRFFNALNAGIEFFKEPGTRTERAKEAGADTM